MEIILDNSMEGLLHKRTGAKAEINTSYY